VSERAAGPGGIERRRAARLTPDELVEPVSVAGARLLDISAYGLQIETLVPLAPGSSVRLQLLVGGVKSEVGARVTDCRRRSGRAWGVGLELTDLPDGLRARLARALGAGRRPRSA
jgi:PilZ domain